MDDESMDSPKPLCREQIATFITNGYVVLPSFIGQEQLASWRAQYWEHIGADPTDRSTWPTTPPGGGRFPNVMMLRPQLGELPQIKAVVDQLGGGKFKGGGSALKAIFPMNDRSTWKAPPPGHIDGYGGSWSVNPTLCATLYLNDVIENGGCFTFYAGKHLSVHRFFRKNPLMIDGSFQTTKAYEDRGWVCLYDDRATENPRATQHVARAGDVLLWHGFLPHSGSKNAQNEPRLAIFARWADPDRKGPTVKMSLDGDEQYPLGWRQVDAQMRQHERFRQPEELFETWSPEVRSVAAATL